jgi:1,4-dihydroxy-2-naphthoate octaprenyltransferase
MRAVLGAARAGAWWEHKLAVLLGTGYATCAVAGVPILRHSGDLALLLGALVPGAVFVSVLNDVTDLESDRRAGKPNRLAGRPRVLAYAILAATILAGGLTAGLAWNDDALALVLYAASWVAFALYSAPPVRLKHHGALGVLADAAGAHVFPQLLVVTVVLHGAGRAFDPGWAAAVGGWSVALGIRSALLHQFADAQSDARAGVRTFVARRPRLARRAGVYVAFPVELAAFATMLVLAGGWVAAVLVAPYALLEARRCRRAGSNVVVVMPAARYRIAMHSYYVTFYPLAFLAASAARHHGDLVILAAHLALFPMGAADTARNVVHELRWPLPRAAAVNR